MSEQSERMEITSTDLLARTEAFLASLSSLCPSDEGMGGRAPLQAFVAKGFECRYLLDDIREHLANRIWADGNKAVDNQPEQRPEQEFCAQCGRELEAGEVVTCDTCDRRYYSK